MTTADQSAPARPARPPLRSVQVSRVNRITPHMVRITVMGDALTEFATQGPGEHFKIAVPPAGEHAFVIPPGQERPMTRTYTPRRYDAASRELDIDFLLHGDGPASSWAARAQVDDTLAIGRPGGVYRLDPEAEWYVIAGDDTALPAIGTILEALPASARAQVYVEVIDAAEEQALDSEASVEVTWLHRGAGAEVAGRLLETAVREARLQGGRGCAWVACESSIMRDIRRHLLNERGMDRGALCTRGHWKYGAVNHPDHDMGDEV